MIISISYTNSSKNRRFAMAVDSYTPYTRWPNVNYRQYAKSVSFPPNIEGTNNMLVMLVLHAYQINVLP